MKKYQNLVTGIQATGEGNLHIGNYCGVIYDIKKIINKTHESIEIESNNLYIFVADLHAMTTYNQDLSKKSLQVVKNLYAFFSNKVHIYIQSQVKGFMEGLWLLSMFSTTGEMNRMTQFKEKKSFNDNNIGLYTYPILMAADVLLMNGHLIPVGEDQEQHIEVIRNITEKVNKITNNNFLIPEMTSSKYRIKSLNDINKKMSKSMPNGCIFLNDSPEIIKKKIEKAQTDEGLFPNTIVNLETRPAAYNLAIIYSVIEDISLEQVINLHQNKTWKEFKSILIESLIKFTSEFQANLKKIKDEDIMDLLKINNSKINTIVNKNLALIYKYFF